MPKAKSVPSYRLHKPSGQARIIIDGRQIYLGKYGSPESHEKYSRIISEWRAGGQQSPTQAIAAPASDLLVCELAASYLRWAQGYYRDPDGTPSGSMDRIIAVLRALNQLYGTVPVAEFGPLSLQAVQQHLIAKGKTRRYINHLTEGTKRVFRWGVTQQLVPVHVHQALVCVAGIKKGRSEARESAPIRPVEDEVIEATLPYLQPIPAAMVQIQRLTGARPGEICIMRPRDIDRSGDVWTYRPSSHKTQHSGRDQIILIGPRAQAILAPFLLRDSDAYCFSPVESEKHHNAERRANRKSPMTPSQRRRSRARRPKKAPGECYTVNTYRQAIRRACDQADKQAHKTQPDVSQKTRLVPRWAPNRIRHTAGTEIRKRHGLEAAQVVLGHSRADVTQVYAERDFALAERIMRQIG